MRPKTLAGLLILLSLFNLNAFAEDAAKKTVAIEPGKKVKLDYTLKVDDKIVDSSKDKGPLSFVYGQMHLIPGFEKGIQGLKAGDKKTLNVEPADAYGTADPKAIVEVPKANFKSQEVKPGMMFTTTDPAGKPLHATVKEVKGESVILDFNHPLAGKSLHFDIEILSVE